MKKYFKSKRRIIVLKNIMYVFILISIFISGRHLLSFKLVSNNNEFINFLLNSSNLTDNNLTNNFLTNFFLRTKINDPSNMLKDVFNTEYEKGEIILMNYMENNVEANTLEVMEEPLVYIYNTHQGEEYVDNNVINGGRLLKEKLESVGVKSIFEESDILEFMRVNNYNHNQSYIASSYYIKEALNNYKNLKLLIDFHRDSAPKNATTTSINGKSCAKVLFVVGLEHDNYKLNLDLAIHLNNMIDSKYPNLSRGIMQKKGPGVNGIYNQNLGSNIILLEFGAEENTFEEISNTIDLIKDIIKEYVDEEKK